MTEPYPDSSSDEGEKEDVIGQGLHGSIDSKGYDRLLAEPEVQASSRRMVQAIYGHWCPLLQRSQWITRNCINEERDAGEEVPEVKLKEGWSFLDEWKVDKSGSFGRVDADGWSYATSFETLFEQTAKKTLQGDGAYESCTSQALGASENL